jgi:hypothetical protein
MAWRFAIRALVLVSVLIVPAATGSSCAGCDKKQCVQPGVYLKLGFEPTAISAVICVDTDCQTLPVQRDAGYAGAPVTWTSGRTVSVSLEVRDAEGSVLAEIVEQRTMRVPRNGCDPCAAFVYTLADGRLQHADQT